ncbi:MAG: SIMPL domain-containing protein [Bacteroidales bacterium]|nr:SIMPL domain-containing protein [Bacteroidales bacterium]
MKDYKFLWLGLSVVVAAIVLGTCFVSAIKTGKSFERTVTVKGLCEKEIKADRVIWPVSYVIGGDDLPSLNQNVKANNEAVISYLKQNGIKDDEISISAPSITDNRATSYSNDAPYHYLITSVITVCTSNVDLVIDLESRQSELVEKGIPVGTGNAWDHQTEYSFNGLNDIKPAMIEEATVNAREAAEKFAKDSNSKLGKIRQASQGQFSISDRDINTPYIKNVRVVTNVVYYLND